MRNTPRTSRVHPSRIESLESRIAPAAFIFAANGGIVKTFADLDTNGTFEALAETFVPFPGYRGEIRVATGDFDGDGNAELVAATAKRNPQILVFDLASDGTRVGAGELITPFAGTKTVGCWVATGDLNNDGKSELLVGAGHNGPPSVEIYSDTNGDTFLNDNLVDTLSVFDPTFKGGVRVASASVNNSAGDDLVAAAGRGRNGMVKVFADTNLDRVLSTEAGPTESFLPFGAKFRGGLVVAAGGISSAGNSGAEIAVARSSPSKDFLIFTDTNNNGLVSDDPLFDTVVVNTVPVAGGLRLAMADTDNSGTFVEVVVGSGGSRAFPVKIFDDDGDGGVLLSDNPPSSSFVAFTAAGPVNVAVGKVRTENFGSGAALSLPDTVTSFSSIFVPSNAGRIRDLNVSLNITHTHDPDLDVVLTHVPSGISVILFTDIPSSISADGMILRLDDEAGTDIGTAVGTTGVPLTGTFNPEDAAVLASFDGFDASGEWLLTITDDAGGDTGTLFSWTLHFTY